MLTYAYVESTIYVYIYTILNFDLSLDATNKYQEIEEMTEGKGGGGRVFK
jgi:hypothetical protein